MSKILVIEDDQDILENINLILISEGFEVICSADGSNALHQIASHNPDLIVSDIMMPNMDGYQFFNKVRAKSKYCNTPFIFLTAKSDMVSLRYGMNLGAEDYITKPFKSEDLIRSIRLRLTKQSAITKSIEEITRNIGLYIPHELRTPLVAIMGNTNLLLSDFDELKKEEIIQMIFSISNASSKLYDRIKKFTLFTEVFLSKNTKNENKSLMVVSTNIMEKVFKENRLINQRSRDICYTFAEAEILCKEEYFLIILNELLENSVKFSAPRSKIYLNGYSTNGSYIVSIKDHGIGMTEEEISNIGAFIQFNRQSKQQDGNGLGLSIVKNLLLSSKAKYEISSKKGEYTTITLCFSSLKTKLSE